MFGDSGGEDAGVEGFEFVGVDASDGSGNAGRYMTGDVKEAVIGELVSYQCWLLALSGRSSGGKLVVVVSR